MKCSLLTPDRDPMGTAIADFYKNGRAAKLRVLSSQFEEDEIPVAQLFRTLDEMPPLEQEALRLANGKILDCGAGSECHALALQDRGKDVEAIDISPPFGGSDATKGSEACLLHQSFRRQFPDQVRHHPHADERVRHHRKT